MKRVLTIAAIAAIATASYAPVIYSTGFEAPDFVPGDIDGQDSWDGSTFASPGYATIVNTFSNGGTQSVLADATGSNWALRETAIDASSGDTTVIVEWDMFIETPGAGGSSGLRGIDVYDGDVDRLVALGVNDLNEVVAIDSNFITTNSAVTVNRDAWNMFRIEMDFVSDTASAFLNGTQIITGVDMSFGSEGGAFTNQFLDADIWVGGGADDRAFYDNYSIAAVPEPATVAVLGLGAAALLRRRRK